MRINTDYKLDNPETMQSGRWFQLAEYPPDVYVCPLCDLPETEGVYEHECDCWD